MFRSGYQFKTPSSAKSVAATRDDAFPRVYNFSATETEVHREVVRNPRKVGYLNVGSRKVSEHIGKRIERT